MKTIIDGVTYTDPEAMEAAIAGFDAALQRAIRADFYGEELPRSVTPRQFRLAMLGAGISTSLVETALQTLEEPTRSIALISWEYATEFQRDNPLFGLAGQLLGMTNEQVDTLFYEAAKL